MTATEIIAAVTSIIQDASYTSADILDLINEGRWEIAGEFDLPLLETTDTVATTDTASEVDLPDDYHKGLYWVGSTNQKRRIGSGKHEYHNLTRFMEMFPVMDQVGIIAAVCVNGSNLLYQGMADDTLTLRYYKTIEDVVTLPETPVGDEIEEPYELPAHLHKPLLVSYCCKEIYSELEDGVEGQKVNTLFWENKHERAKRMLADFIKISKPVEPVFVRDSE